MNKVLFDPEMASAVDDALWAHVGGWSPRSACICSTPVSDCDATSCLFRLA